MGDKVLAKVAAGDVDRLRKEAERKKDLRHNVRAMKEKEAEYKENLQSRVAEKVQARGLLMETVRPRYEREVLVCASLGCLVFSRHRFIFQDIVSSFKTSFHLLSLGKGACRSC
mmetsp:Transcript_28172/g.74377  ORF Transcript_28172/g.74377 Transcript_28172/m.74377 type:complete len:114 (+) Transcript_28172:369-710(+)